MSWRQGSGRGGRLFPEIHKYVFSVAERLLKRGDGGLSRNYDFKLHPCPWGRGTHGLGALEALGLTLAIESLVGPRGGGARLWRGRRVAAAVLLALGGRYAKLPPQV